MKKQYDIALLGPVSRDYNIEPDGSCEVEIGGAIVYSPFAAKAAGADRIALVKGVPMCRMCESALTVLAVIF